MALTKSPEVWYTELLQSPPEDDLKKLKVDTYWTRLMKSAVPVPELDGMLGIAKTNCFLFCGVPGAGKRSLAKAMAGTLCRMGYSFLQASGPDFDEDLRQRVQVIFQQVTQENPLVFLCEDVECCEDPKLLSEGLAQLGQVCKQQKLPFVMIVISSQEEEIPPALLRECYLCRFTAPDLEERAAFYEAALGSRFPLQKGLKPRDLAVASEGLHLRQLVHTLRLMQFGLKEEALVRYKNHFSMAEEAVRNKELVVDMSMFRAIVAKLKEPEKAPAQQPVQILQPLSAVPVAAAAPASQNKSESKTDTLRNSKNASDFFKNL